MNNVKKKRFHLVIELTPQLQDEVDVIRDYYGVPFPKMAFPYVVEAIKKMQEQIPPAARKRTPEKPGLNAHR